MFCCAPFQSGWLILQITRIGSPNVIVVVYVPACAPLHDVTANKCYALKAGYRCSPRGINVVSLSSSVAGDIASDTSLSEQPSKSPRNAMKTSSQAPAVSYWGSVVTYVLGKPCDPRRCRDHDCTIYIRILRTKQSEASKYLGIGMLWNGEDFAEIVTGMCGQVWTYIKSMVLTNQRRKPLVTVT